MAHKKAGGTTRLGRDSNPQYLGVKVSDGQTVKTGMVLVRQRGSKIHQGKNVKKGKDDTLFTLTDGKVKFQTKQRKNFTGVLKTAKYLHVLPEEKK